MKAILEGSEAIARTIRSCRVGVISAYPITPQTRIVEFLATLVANGELNARFVNVESEHSAASVVLGASATGVRAYSATSSQGFILMSEVLFNIAGLRLPLVLTVANRALSAPISIWNDHQDTVTLRDAGWIQFYGESIQEVCDLHIQGYRISEDPRVHLPVMVCLDGYILTHGHEVVDIPEPEEVDKFLPPYKPVHVLDVDKPVSMGLLAGPEAYMETRYAIHKTMEEVLEIIPEVAEEFARVFGRKNGGLIEAYRVEDAERVIVGKGSMMGTVKEVVDELREEGEKVGAVKVITHRPFPAKVLYETLKGVKEIAVLEKSISLGFWSPLFTEIKALFQGKKENPLISGFVIGLGGRDITKDNIREVFLKWKGKSAEAEFINLNQEMLKTGGE